MKKEPVQILAESFNALVAHINKLTAIIYANQLHEYDCPVFMHKKHYEKFFDYMPSGPPPDCTCWLSKQGELE